MRLPLRLPVRHLSCSRRIPWIPTRRTSPLSSEPWESTWKLPVSSVMISRRVEPCSVPPFSLTWPMILPLSVLLLRVLHLPPPSTLPTSVTFTFLSSLPICLRMPMPFVRYLPPVRRFLDVVDTPDTCTLIYPPFTSVPDVWLEEMDPLPSFLSLPCLTMILRILFPILPVTLLRDRFTSTVSSTLRVFSHRLTYFLHFLVL
mmetsp:Transcript_26543/g.39273  ORF Transcript_26543/g.39273 Transcript_26543/m.39273 type:complete len:202 (+) Transcript_26543:590-1195(+)